MEDPITGDAVTRSTGGVASDGTAYSWDTLGDLKRFCWHVPRSPVTRAPLTPHMTWYGTRLPRLMYSAGEALRWSRVTFSRPKEWLSTQDPDDLWCALHKRGALGDGDVVVHCLEVGPGAGLLSSSPTYFECNCFQALRPPAGIGPEHMHFAIVDAADGPHFLFELAG